MDILELIYQIKLDLNLFLLIIQIVKEILDEMERKNRLLLLGLRYLIEV